METNTNQFDVEYIKNHAVEIHTYESFGHAVAALISESAASQLEAAGETGTLSSPVSLENVQVELGPIETKGCLWIRIRTPWGTVTKHIRI